MSRFFTDTLSELDPYTPGEQPQDMQYVKLNTNESPFPPSPKVLEALNSKEVSRLNLYSDPETKVLLKKIADHYGVKPTQVIAGNGSDELLGFSFCAFCDPNHGAAFANVTYSFYKVWAKLFHIPVTCIPLKSDFSLDVHDYMGINQTIFIANPNAPTGIALTTSEIEEVLKSNPGNVVVVDEAYVDFGAESCVKLVDKYDNLLVVQTFSKSRSLAGARLGMAIGCEELIADLNRIKFSFNPYNINRLTILAGTAAMEDKEYFEKCTKAVMDVRKYTVERLKAMGFTMPESSSNFIFPQTDRLAGAELYKRLKAKGVLVRHFDDPLLTNHCRITIGSAKQMNILMDKIQEIFKELGV